MNQLATRFRSDARVTRSHQSLTDDEIRRVAPSIYADTPHYSRSARYGYIPTSQVLQGLRQEGFQPFMACQARARGDRGDFTKHMLRLRHVSQIDGEQANEIVLINSHDGSSAYQMLAGVFRFVCENGMVCGETVEDLRIPHRGDVAGRVIEGAYRILDDFENIDRCREGMQGVQLSDAEAHLLARSALTLRFEDESRAPVVPEQVLQPKRFADTGQDLWSRFNVVQENLVRGGLLGRNASGRITTTRAVNGIDGNVKLNRALWMLADGMRKLKGG